MNCFFSFERTLSSPEISHGSAPGDEHDERRKFVIIAGTYGRLSQKPRAGFPLT
jgi:hypothetical protein